MFSSNPPLGLYIHLPWCEKKCPYCDFNSHEADSIPQQAYVDALLDDLAQDLPLIWGRRIESIFIGGGTPSLFSAQSIDRLFSGLRSLINLAPAIEVTMESNPGSADAANYQGYREAGVNRLSIGIQSFDDRQLALLGRVHNGAQAQRAFRMARAAGFDNINLDLMFGLPGQGLAAAQADLARALALEPEHLSHYQLTIEPNTMFHHRRPQDMPDDDLCFEQQQACQAQLAAADYRQYEISAFSRAKRESYHNLNYWNFGDYLGIGAGAHGKITLAGENRVIRRVRLRHPRAYLEQHGAARIASETELDSADLCFEFMLNALRLKQGFATRLFHDNTGLSLNEVLPTVKQACDKGLLAFDGEKITPTELGFCHLNDLQALFLTPQSKKNKPFFESSPKIMHN
ncbi:MAG: radical SAM family heme chaperone HemW [Gammaproteobacteria bacterium]|jgi:oxygen-independent coproporphyrinogen-3 oxidase|nr:radical SAM family heme chaperone HemW [Gammaproteobacteria bacterium]